MGWRGLLAACAAGCAALAAVGFTMLGPSNELRPLLSGAANSDSQIALPKDTIIASISEGAEIVAPFLLHENSSASGGMALVLPKGTRTPEHKGKATLTVNAASEGPYFAWARAHWRDTCSNSFSLKVGEQPEKDVGNDDVFNTWHWVPAGKFNLVQGKNPVVLTEREDGIELDQLLFTHDAAFQPTGQVSPIGCSRGVRRFADTFARSPGHGMDGWDLVAGDWHIAFSFDPNRIPNQYALVGAAAEPGKGDALALIQGAPWYGTRISFSINPLKDGKFGAVLDRGLDGQGALLAGFEMAGGHASAVADQARTDLGAAMKLDQWHRVTIERWAWILRIVVDGREVLARYDLAPRAGRIGLFVSSGSAVFDDVDVEEIPWQADNGELTLPWAVAKDAKWFRPAAAAPDQKPSSPLALLGKSGSISTALGEMPVAEVVLEEENPPGGEGKPCAITGAGLKALENIPGAPAGTRVFAASMSKIAAGAGEKAGATIQAGGGDAHIRRIAIRYGKQAPETYFIGPYHFANNELVDPSDYLDFTPEEYKAMAKSADAEKLRRVAKIKSLVGNEGGDESPWVLESGGWRLNDGNLDGHGPDARLRHAQEICADLDMRLKVRLTDAKSRGAIDLYGGTEPGLRFELAPATGTASAPAAPSKSDAKTPAGAAAKNTPISIAVPGDGKFHELLIRVRGQDIATRLDAEPAKSLVCARGDGGRIHLNVNAGVVEFNDIEFSVQRADGSGYFYPFNRAETDWWRETQGKGQWMDHGGIACVLASSWISLSAMEGSGLIRNKHAFGPNVMVAFDVEENSEWFGWDKSPNHLHYPYDNVTILLSSPKNPDAYRLVLNTENRSATVLYRGGKEVARVSQRNFFPMRYVGGHGPYFPRRNRICLIRREGLLRVIINGREVLHFEDKEPLESTEVALGGNETRINFSDIEIRDLKKSDEAKR